MRKYGWLVLIIALFLSTRIVTAMNAGSFWFDEAFSVHFASMPLADMWQFLQFEHNPLVHFLALSGWMKIFGISEIAARSLSVVAGFFSLIMIYFLGSKLFSRSVGLWAAFLMTISSMQLYHQTEARMYGLLGLWVLLFVYSYWKQAEQQSSNSKCPAYAYQLRTGRQSPNKRTNRKFQKMWVLVYVISGILLVHTHMTAWALVAAVWVHWIFASPPSPLSLRRNKDAVSYYSRRGGGAWIASNLLIVGSFLFWFIPVMRNKQLVGNVSQGWFFFQNESGYWLTHLSNYLLNGEQALLIRSVGALVIVLLVVMGFTIWHKPDWWQKIKSLFERSKYPFNISLDWSPEMRFVLTLFLVPLLIGFALQITVTKYLLAPGLIMLVLMAVGIERIRSSHLKLTIGLVLVLLVLPMHLRFMSEPRHNWDKAADKLEELAQMNPEAQILSHSFAWSLPLSFYYQGAIPIDPFYPLDDDLLLDERIVRYNWQAIVNDDNVDEMERIVGDNTTLILISSTPAEKDKDPVKAWLWENGWMLEDVYSWPGYGDPELLLFKK